MGTKAKGKRKKETSRRGAEAQGKKGSTIAGPGGTAGGGGERSRRSVPEVVVAAANAGDGGAVPDGIWLDVKTCAALVGISTQAFHESVRPLLAAGDVRGDGKGGKGTRLNAVAVVAARVKRCEERVRESLRGGESALLNPADGVVTEQLERWRRIKADREQIKLDLERGSHVPLDAVDAMIAQLEGGLKGAVEALQRRYGPDVAKEYNAAVEGFVTSVREGAGRFTTEGTENTEKREEKLD